MCACTYKSSNVDDIERRRAQVIWSSRALSRHIFVASHYDASRCLASSQRRVRGSVQSVVVFGRRILARKICSGVVGHQNLSRLTAHSARHATHLRCVMPERSFGVSSPAQLVLHSIFFAIKCPTLASGIDVLLAQFSLVRCSSWERYRTLQYGQQSWKDGWSEWRHKCG